MAKFDERVVEAESGIVRTESALERTARALEAAERVDRAARGSAEQGSSGFRKLLLLLAIVGIAVVAVRKVRGGREQLPSSLPPQASRPITPTGDLAGTSAGRNGDQPDGAASTGSEVSSEDPTA